jgi:hypothetical protein
VGATSGPGASVQPGSNGPAVCAVNTGLAACPANL